MYRKVKFTVKVEQLVDTLAKEDVFNLPAGPDGKGSVRMYEDETVYAWREYLIGNESPDTRAALDAFHECIPISVLDDFEITLVKVTGGPVLQAEDDLG